MKKVREMVRKTCGILVDRGIVVLKVFGLMALDIRMSCFLHSIMLIPKCVL